MRRVRVCAGGSTFVSVGMDRKSPAASAATAAGHGGEIGVSVLAAENVVRTRRDAHV